MNVSNTTPPDPRAPWGIFLISGISFPSAFILILGLLHLLSPEFDPSWRMISEYETGAYGWLMQSAFFSWGLGVVAFLLLGWGRVNTLGGKIGFVTFGLIALALFGAGIWKTDPIIALTSGTENRIHTVCGALVIMTFPLAATLAAVPILRRMESGARKTLLPWMTVLVWLGLLGFFGSISISKAVHHSASRVGPDILMGWPNRIMVVLYNLWLVSAVRALSKKASKPTPP